MQFMKEHIIWFALMLGSSHLSIVSHEMFAYEEDMGDYCKRGVFKSVFLGYLTIESESESLLFNRQPTLYNCSISIRTESGNYIIVVIKLTSAASHLVAKEECRKNMDQMVVYPMGETFGNYWSDHMKPLMRYRNSTHTPPTEGYASHFHFAKNPGRMNTEEIRNTGRSNTFLKGLENMLTDVADRIITIFYYFDVGSSRYDKYAEIQSKYGGEYSAPILLGEVNIAQFDVVLGAPYSSADDDDDLMPDGPTAEYLTQVVDIATLEPVLETATTEEVDIARYREKMLRLGESGVPEDATLIEAVPLLEGGNEVSDVRGDSSGPDDVSRRGYIRPDDALSGSTDFGGAATRRSNALDFLDPWKLVGARRRNVTLVSPRTVPEFVLPMSNVTIEKNITMDLKNEIEITDRSTDDSTITDSTMTRVIIDDQQAGVTVPGTSEHIEDDTANVTVDQVTTIEEEFAAAFSISSFEDNVTLGPDNILISSSNANYETQISLANTSEVSNMEEYFTENSNIENRSLPIIETDNKSNGTSTVAYADSSSVLKYNTSRKDSKDWLVNIIQISFPSTNKSSDNFILNFNMSKRFPPNNASNEHISEWTHFSNAPSNFPTHKCWFQFMDEIRKHLKIRPMRRDKSWDNIVNAAPSMVDILSNRSSETNDETLPESQIRENKFEIKKDSDTSPLSDPEPAASVAESRSKRHLGVIDIDHITPYDKRITRKKPEEEVTFDGEEAHHMHQLIEPARSGEIWQKIVLEPVLRRYIGPRAVSACDHIIDKDFDARGNIVTIVFNSRVLLSLTNFSLPSALVVVTTARGADRTRRPCSDAQRECLVRGTRVCVSAAVACDGVPNCGSASLYDEDGVSCRRRDGGRLLLPVALLACAPVLFYVLYCWLRRCVPKVSEAFFVYTEQAQNILYLDTIMRSPHDKVDPYDHSAYADYPEIELDLGEQDIEANPPTSIIRTWLKFIKRISGGKPREDKKTKQSSLNEELIRNYLPVKHPAQNVGVQTGPSLEMGNVSSHVQPEFSGDKLLKATSDENTKLNAEENSEEGRRKSPLIGRNLRTDKRNDLNVIQFLKQRRSNIDAKNASKVKEVVKNEEKLPSKAMDSSQEIPNTEDSNSGDAVPLTRVRQIRFLADTETIVHEYDEDEESEDSEERTASAFRSSQLYLKADSFRSRFDRPRQLKKKGLKLMKIRGTPNGCINEWLFL